ncbi:MAG: endonuclease/exonuclease/phosphatase family protein, partial [Aggregatilineales bacterium]
YSRLPILENSEIDTLELKHQRVVIDMNGREIAIYNIHLDMPADSATQIDAPFLPEYITNYNTTKRNQQIDALLTHLETEDLPYIVVGDFNTSDTDPIYGELAANMTDAFRSAGSGFGLTWPAGASEEQNSNLPLLMRLDYVWYSQSIQALSAVPGPVLGSDHLPLSVVVEIAR